MKLNFLKNGAQSVGNVFRGTNQQDSSLFSTLQKPSDYSLSNSYNTNVNNTGNYSFPTKTDYGDINTIKPLGDYSFTKNANEYVPNTDFAQSVANNDMPSWKNALSNGLQTFSQSKMTNNAVLPIAITGFQFENGQIRPAEQLKSNLYNFLVQ